MIAPGTLLDVAGTLATTTSETFVRMGRDGYAAVHVDVLFEGTAWPVTINLSRIKWSFIPSGSLSETL